LFRYAVLHWSIPVSAGYGRRIRFLILDEQNGKLLGVIGLGDPVFGLAARDKWIGWSHEDRRKRLRYVMDAYVLGSVPPYSSLLCGKLVAMLAASNEIRDAIRQKYRGVKSRISRKPHDGRVVLVTTASALGRSSVYNRLRFRDRSLFHRVGFIVGSGEFHFSNGLYDAITDYANEHCEPTLRNSRWGRGFRNRREVIKATLPKLELPLRWIEHGIRRELFAAPLVKNLKEFLTGRHSRAKWLDQSADDLFLYFRERWLLPRAKWDLSFLDWKREEWRLWGP
jgi:hypothetical protein